MNKTLYVIQRDKNSKYFVNEKLDDYCELLDSHLFKTKSGAALSLDPNKENEVVRRVKVTFELEE